MCAGTHYNMLPINQPRCPFHFGQEDGAQNWMHRDEEVSSLGCVADGLLLALAASALPHCSLAS